MSVATAHDFDKGLAAAQPGGTLILIRTGNAVSTWSFRGVDPWGIAWEQIGNLRDGQASCIIGLVPL